MDRKGPHRTGLDRRGIHSRRLGRRGRADAFSGGLELTGGHPLPGRQTRHCSGGMPQSLPTTTSHGAYRSPTTEVPMDEAAGNTILARANAILQLRPLGHDTEPSNGPRHLAGLALHSEVPALQLCVPPLCIVRLIGQPSNFKGTRKIHVCIKIRNHIYFFKKKSPR